MDRMRTAKIACASVKGTVGGGTTEVILIAENCLKIYLLAKK